MLKMAKHDKVLHHIQSQMSEYPSTLCNAMQRLFTFEDNCKQCGGCVIDSVVARLLFAKFNINAEIHLGEICADGNQDAYHCWLTIDDRIFDIAIYGNSNYNPYYKGKAREYPVILENIDDIIYADGVTETYGWIGGLSGLSFDTYIKKCPDNLIYEMYCYALDISINKASIEEIYHLAKDIKFPVLQHRVYSPSGKPARYYLF